MLDNMERFFLFCFFDKEDFNKEQLKEIQIGLQDNLEYDEICVYAIPIIPADEMAKLRKNIKLISI